MTDHASLFLLATVLVLATVLAIFAMKYAAAARSRRDGADRNNELQALAERTAAAQAETIAALHLLQAELKAVRDRVDAIDTTLREVA